MNIEKLFDLYCNYMDADGKSEYMHKNDAGKEFKLNTVQQGEVLRRSIQAFVHGYSLEVDKKKIQAFSGSADLAQMTKDVFNVTQAENEYDVYWSEAFRSIQLKKGQLNWEIADVNSGQDFEIIPEGGKVQFHGIAGSKVSVGIQKYGMGMGVTWETVEGRKLYLFWDQLRDVRSKLFNLWADVHYGLMATAGLSNQVSWGGAAGDGELRRDILTLNDGLHQIAEANKDKGYGTPNAFKYKIYADPVLEERIEAAFRVTTAQMANVVGSTTVPAQQVRRRITSRYYSYNSAIPTNKALLVVSGNKLQNSVYLREKSFMKEEIESMNQLRTYWTAFGATVADTDQVYELAFA